MVQGPSVAHSPMYTWNPQGMKHYHIEKIKVSDCAPLRTRTIVQGERILSKYRHFGQCGSCRRGRISNQIWPSSTFPCPSSYGRGLGLGQPWSFQQNRLALHPCHSQPSILLLAFIHQLGSHDQLTPKTYRFFGDARLWLAMATMLSWYLGSWALIYYSLGSPSLSFFKLCWTWPLVPLCSNEQKVCNR